MTGLVLASRSAARAQLLVQAGVAFETAGSGVDEDSIKAVQAERGARPAGVAEVLAAAKAENVSRLHAGLVIGADQTLELDGRLFDKPASPQAAREQLLALRGRRHRLHSAVALAEAGAVVWRELKSADLVMRDFSDAYLDGYMTRNAEAVQGCVGAYQLESEGVQLFERIDGDYFTILGLPLTGLLGELRRRGVLQS